MKKQYLFFLVFVFAFVLYRRQRENFQLPDFNGICPEGYVLSCVSTDLHGISEQIPFPESLPQPCEDPNFPSTPLCLPHSSKVRPPTKKS